MTIRKPCRISNKPIRNIAPGPVKTSGSLLQVILCEEQDRYIWSVRIPGGPGMEDRIFIRDGALYITGNDAAIRYKGRCIRLRIPLPADVVPEIITAFRRPYGFKILLPKRRGKGKVIPVDVQ